MSHRGSSRWLHRCFAGRTMLLALGVTSLGAADTAVQGVGEELALFDDLPVVVSASRQETSVNRSAVPVSVLSHEDLSASGHYQIAEVLRFVPGVDVRRVDRSHPAVGVHGFHGAYSDRTLSLIDGRNADSPVFGGSEWYRVPLMMDDIERIEVVRGPGGAAWGANAFNGVINVITRDPDEMLGLHGSATVTDLGDHLVYARWCHAIGDLSWRIGVFQQQMVSSREALDDDTIPDHDASGKTGTDNALVWHANDRTTLRAGIGYAKLDRGVFEFIGYLPPGEDQLDTTRAYTQLDQELSAHAAYRIGWYGNFLTSRRPAVFNERSRENVVETQLDFSGVATHHLSLGGEWRMTDIEQFNDDPNQLVMVEAPYREQRYGAFIIDQWQATSDLLVEAQFRGDYYDGTGSDWSGRLALLYDLNQYHIVRLAAARAYRTPLPGLRDSSVSRPSGLNVLPSDVENEHIWSMEAGYAAELTGDLRLQVDGFYQQYEDLIGYQVTPAVPAGFDLRRVNFSGADGYGGEVQCFWSPVLGWDDRRAQVKTWYGYHHLTLDDEVENFRAWTPARHKAGAGLRLPLPHALSFTVNYAYNDSSIDRDQGSEHVIGIHHQLDVTLAWALPDGYGELMIGGWDVLHAADEEADGTGTYIPHETPGRTLFVRTTLEF